jgi:signal transduction histidine kinase
MEASKVGTALKLDPKTQELYARLEEEKRKNRQLNELKKQNAELISTINKLENERASSDSQHVQKTVQQTRKKLAIQEQLNEKKVQNKVSENKQKRIDLLIDSLDDQYDVHELDSKTIDELKATLDTLLQARKKRTIIIKKLSDQNKELSEKNEDLLFTRDKLAHDLRSLMSSILSTLSLLEMGEKEVVEQLLPTLESKCRVFMDLVVALSEDKIDKDFLYVNEITELLNLNPYQDSEEAVIDVTGIDIPIFADKAAIYDVAQNLINNSVKYSGKHGKDLEIKIEVSQDSTNTSLLISDNGKGIPEEKVERVFDLYNRAGIDDSEGKGIGLYMVQKLIDSHKGSITYNESYSEGAQFVVTLPNAPQI